MLTEVSTITGPALNWAVTKCTTPNDARDNRPRFWIHRNSPKLVCRETYNHHYNPQGYELCRYSTDWGQSGPIIEREGLHLRKSGCQWQCDYWNETTADFDTSYGPTLLIAAMRCYVTRCLGNTVYIPDELF